MHHASLSSDVRTRNAAAFKLMAEQQYLLVANAAGITLVQIYLSTVFVQFIGNLCLSVKQLTWGKGTMELYDIK